jgi:uncharacterized protein CbrC (UPF0167 family)
MKRVMVDLVLPQVHKVTEALSIPGGVLPLNAVKFECEKCGMETVLVFPPDFNCRDQELKNKICPTCLGAHALRIDLEIPKREGEQP